MKGVRPRSQFREILIAAEIAVLAEGAAVGVQV